DLSAAGRTDDLADTLDYGAITGAVARIVSGERFALLERLAQRIADEVLLDERVAAVPVAVRKLRPPVPAHLAPAGVRITRSRPADQPPFLNCVVELHTDLTPRQLLELAQQLERAAHRVRTERWGPRTLDVDVLLVGDLTVNEPDLVVPHPRMWERDFVLRPLRDLAPELVP